MITSHRKGLLWLVILVAALGAVLFVNYRERVVDEDQLRINRLHHFVRLSSPTCEELAASVVALYIEGMDTGLRGAGCRDVGNKLRAIPFDFRHVRNRAALTDEQDRTVWTTILGHPMETLDTPRVLRYQLKRIGPDGKTENLEPEDATVALVIFEWWAPAAAGLVVLVWLALVYLGAMSALVRDAAPAGTPLAQRSFSLAKVQMAWWFAIIFASFVLLWLVTGETPALSGQALSLLGLSGVTTIAASGINGTRLCEDGKSGVFLRELLSDGDGVAIHRFQMLVMTVALGFVFLIHVARTLTMPEFDASLLTVMGISAATYVGMKIPEQARAEQDGAPRKAPDGGAAGGAGGVAPVPGPTDPTDPKAGYSAEVAGLKPIAPEQAVAHGRTAEATQHG